MKTFKPDETISVRVAEEFELCLPALAAAGYEWRVAGKTAELTFLKSSFRPPAKDQIGGESVQRLRLRADRPGTFLLHLVYQRQWDAAPSATREVQITVQGPA